MASGRTEGVSTNDGYRISVNLEWFFFEISLFIAICCDLNLITNKHDLHLKSMLAIKQREGFTRNCNSALRGVRMPEPDKILLFTPSKCRFMVVPLLYTLESLGLCRTRYLGHQEDSGTLPKS